jgi:hypothetical protein
VDQVDQDLAEEREKVEAAARRAEEIEAMETKLIVF